MSGSRIIISSDSTCDLSAELIDKYNIQIAHMPVILGDKSYLDGVDILPEQLFDYYISTGNLAKTSSINTAMYTEHFNSLIEMADAVIHISLSSSLSAAYNNARLAALDIDNVYVIDSIELSTGIGLQIIKAAQMAEDGAPVEDIVSYIEKMKHCTDASFVIDTLEYLHKGGRCSGVARFGANVLKLKPCIEVKNGAMDVGKKFRGRMTDVLIEYTHARLSNLDDIEDECVFITHTCADHPDWVESVRAEVESLGFFKNIYVTQAGSTISSHCGPGTLGVLFTHKEPIE